MAFMGRTNMFLQERQIGFYENKGDKKSVIIFVYVGAKQSFHLLHDHETPPERGIYGRCTLGLSPGNRRQPVMGINGNLSQKFLFLDKRRSEQVSTFIESQMSSS